MAITTDSAFAAIMGVAMVAADPVIAAGHLIGGTATGHLVAQVNSIGSVRCGRERRLNRGEPR